MKQALWLIAGIGVGYLVAWSQLEKRYTDKLAEDHEQITEFYERNHAKREESFKKTSAAMGAYQGVATPKQAGISLDEKSEKSVVTPSRLVKTDEEPVGNSTRKIAYNKISQPDSVGDDHISVITEEDFARGEDNYDEHYLTYYSGDDVLAGQSDHKIDREYCVEAFGEKLLERMRASEEPWGDTGLLYVKNTKMRKMFEIGLSPAKHSDEHPEQYEEDDSETE